LGSQMYSEQDSQNCLTGSRKTVPKEVQSDDDMNWLYPDQIRSLRTFICPSTRNYIRTNVFNGLVADLQNNATDKNAWGHSYEVFGCWQPDTTTYPRKTQKSVLSYQWQNTFAPYIQAGGNAGGPLATIIIFDMMEPHGRAWPYENSPNPDDGHGSAGGNAAFGDGHASWVSAKKWKDTIVKSQDYPPNYPLAP